MNCFYKYTIILFIIYKMSKLKFVTNQKTPKHNMNVSKDNTDDRKGHWQHKGPNTNMTDTFL